MKPSYTFSRAPQVNVPRSVFDLGHEIKTTIGTDYLYPIYGREVLPGDTFEFSHSLFGRLSTPLTPIMDRLYLDTFFFFVPTRLIDSNFKKLMGESPVGMPDNNVVVPKLTAPDGGVEFNSLYDYFRIRPGVGGLKFSPYKMRAYTYIYNDWFRDANLIEPVPVFGSFDYPPDDNAVESTESYSLLKRAKRLDYFTGALPWPQRGPTTYLPLSGSAPVGVSATDNSLSSAYGLHFRSTDNGELITADRTLGIHANATPGRPGYLAHANAPTWSNETTGVVPSNLYADLSEATALTVNQLREAVAVQHLYEAFARGGSNRYIEILRSTFNVQSPDARLQRSEYLGGSSTLMNVTTVAQTSASEQGSPLGNLASFVTVNNRASWKKSFTEHGYIIGVANVRADLSYSQGLDREDTRTTRLDFYWPQLANLGEQAVLNKEIFAQGTADDEDVFGYQERWAEYRYHPNSITGTFRPDHPQSLDVWHLSQEFESLPMLNKSFIEEAVPIDRVIAVTDEPPVLLWGEFFVKAARPLPLYSIPGLERM